MAPTDLPISLDEANDASTLDPLPKLLLRIVNEKSYEKDRQVLAQLLTLIIYLFTQFGVQTLIGEGEIYPVYSFIGRFIRPLGVDSSFPLIILCILLLRSSAFDYRSMAKRRRSRRRFFFSCLVKGVFRGVLFVLAMSTLFPLYANREVAKYSEIDFMSMLQPGSQTCVYNCLLGASTNHSTAYIGG